MTFEPKKRYDNYSSPIQKSCYLVTKQIQPTVKYGCPTNATGLLGELIVIYTKPMPPVTTFIIRDRNVFKEIHDIAFKTSMLLGIAFADIKKAGPPKRINK